MVEQKPRPGQMSNLTTVAIPNDVIQLFQLLELSPHWRLVPALEGGASEML